MVTNKEAGSARNTPGYLGWPLTNHAITFINNLNPFKCINIYTQSAHAGPEAG